MDDSLKILIVVHEPAAASAIAAACAGRGWESTLATDVVAALLAARRSPPDAVVIEAGLPAGGAMITLKRLRATVDTAATPIVLVGGEGPIEALLAAGAQAHVADPANAAALQAALGRPAAAVPVPVEAPVEIVRHPMRMAALRASGLLDTAPDDSFDRLTLLVSRLLGAPTALFSLVDRDRQFFKSAVGLAEPWATARETPLSHSFCQWVVSGRDSVRVSDAREHKVLRHNEALRDLGVVAYAGVPVISVQGEALGSLCAIDGQPRSWTQDDEATLNDLARLAEACIAHATLVQQPPQAAGDLDHYVEACGGAITGAVDILRRHGSKLGVDEREVLHGLIEEHAAHLVQLNRLIQVSKAIG
ncbi:MAG: GAF domain-containing protein [Pseudomonadota bacterium]